MRRAGAGERSFSRIITADVSTSGNVMIAGDDYSSGAHGRFGPPGMHRYAPGRASRAEKAGGGRGVSRAR